MSITLGDFDDVTLGSSAIFETHSLEEAHEKPRTRSQSEVVSPVAFRPHLSMGLALGLIAKDLVGLPQAICPGRHYSGNFRGLSIGAPPGWRLMDGGVSTVLMKSQKWQDVKKKPAQYPFRFSGDNKKMLMV